MPETILRLQKHLNDVENPESVLWRGQVQQGPFLAKNVKLETRPKSSRPMTARKEKGPKGQNGQKDDGIDVEPEVEMEEEEGRAEDGDVVDNDDDDEDEDEGDAKVTSTRLGTDKHIPKDDIFASAKPGTSWAHVVATNPIQAEVIKIVRG